MSATAPVAQFRTVHLCCRTCDKPLGKRHLATAASAEQRAAFLASCARMRCARCADREARSAR